MTIQATQNDVLARLPHRAPFRFVSEVHALEPTHGVGAWVVTGQEDFLRGHFPGEPIIPGVLLAESLAQLAGLVWLGAGASAGASARLAQVDVKFLAPVRPPATIHLAAHWTRSMGELALFSVEATANSVRAAAGSLILARTPPVGTSP